MTRIGILGGTFDPVHNMHLELATQALVQYELDTVLFVPAGLPVRKLYTTHASAKERLHMLELACRDTAAFEVCSLEVDRPQITYTIDTLRELKALYGEESRFFLILGEDAVRDLSTWKNSREIARLVCVLFARRIGSEGALVLPEGFTCLELQIPLDPVSSTTIRRLLREGEDVHSLVPAEVLSYIMEQGLYDESE